jgi:homoserine kinase
VIHPHLEIKTAHARALLGDTVGLADAIQQWANLGAFVDALHRADFALLARTLEDRIAEPRRAPLVPGFDAIKAAAVSAGALGCSLSGSGPSMFALCRGDDRARRIAAAMSDAVVQAIGSAPETYVSPIVARGARVLPS